MGEMDGVEFLMCVREEFPETIRLVLSGTGDGQLVVRAASVAHQILGKPCEPVALYGIVSRAFALRDHLHSESMKTLLHKMGKLPSLPVIYDQVLRESALEDASVGKIGKLIEQDPSLCAKVLQIVNSAYMGLRSPVSNLVQACTMLGLGNLRNIVLAAELFGPPDRQKFAKGFNFDALWNHSLAVADTARRIASHETSDKNLTDLSFAAGLLHEIGQLVLATQAIDQFASTIQYARDSGISLVEAEEEILGATHVQVGSYLLELWGLPDAVTEAIAFHTRPSQSPHAKIASAGAAPEFSPLLAVHIANCLPAERSTETLEIDTDYLEHSGYAGKLDEWRELCSQDDMP